MEEQNSINTGNTSTGYLIVEVSAARGTLPIENARVTVKSSDSSDDTLKILYTDRSGRTERLALPTPPLALSQEAGRTNVYAAYDIEVTQDGYYSGMYYGVPVFSGITSLQPVALIPLSAYRPEENRPNIDADFEESEPNL